MEAFFSFLQSFSPIAQYVVPSIWVALGCAVTWYLLSAKRLHEITSHETEILWKTHKQFSRCSAKKFEKITKTKKIFGYICQCGFQHMQERPIINIRH
jgi:hypothetical protein